MNGIINVYKEKGYTSAKGQAVIIEGESAALKSTRAIVPKADSTSPVPYPSDSKKPVSYTHLRAHET